MVSGSSVYNARYPLAAANNGDRKGLNWGAGGGWNDATWNASPDWVEIAFAGSASVSEINVFTLQDNYASPVAPTEAMSFSKYGITAFDVQYWNGSAWVTVPSGSVTGNTQVWRHFSFPAVTTERIRVVVNGALAGYSRIVEIEAYGTVVGAGNTPPSVQLTAPSDNAVYTAPATLALTAAAADSDGTVSYVEFYAGTTLLGADTTAPYGLDWGDVGAGQYVITAKAYDDAGSSTVSAPLNVTVSPPGGTQINVAAQSNGAVVSGSSVYNARYPLAAANNGDRKGLNWGAGGGWNDATWNASPDWVEIAFAGSASVSEINVFTLQDNYASPVAPTEAMSFSKYGITAFDVQYWNGSAWVTVPSGSVTGNTQVWRHFSFPAVTTERIRVVVNGALAGYSRIVEIEAYGTSGS